MYIKEYLGSTIAFGFEGDEKEVDKFEILCENYSIARITYREFSNFCYVLTSPTKLLNGLSLYFQHKHFLDKDCSADGLRILSIQEAKRFIIETKNEPFYTNILRKINMIRDNWEDNNLCFKLGHSMRDDNLNND